MGSISSVWSESSLSAWRYSLEIPIEHYRDDFDLTATWRHYNVICCIYSNIYILNVAALDETIILSGLHFSMQNIGQSRGLGRASRWSNVNVNQ